MEIPDLPDPIQRVKAYLSKALDKLMPLEKLGADQITWREPWFNCAIYTRKLLKLIVCNSYKFAWHNEAISRSSS